MSNRRQGSFFPTAEGECVTYTPDGTMRAQDDGRVLSNLIDGSYAHGGPHGCAEGGAFGYTDHMGGAGDTTGAPVRRPPEYGGIFGIAIKG